MQQIWTEIHLTLPAITESTEPGERLAKGCDVHCHYDTRQMYEVRRMSTFTTRNKREIAVIIFRDPERSYLRRAGHCVHSRQFTQYLSCSRQWHLTWYRVCCLLARMGHQPIRGRDQWEPANKRRAEERDVLSLKVSLYATGLLNIQPLRSEKNVKCYFLSY